MDIVGLGAQNWDPSPGVGVEEGVHEILETYPLDGHSQVEAAGLVDMHPEMKKKHRFNSSVFYPLMFCLLAKVQLSQCNEMRGRTRITVS